MIILFFDAIELHYIDIIRGCCKLVPERKPHICEIC